MWRDWFNFARQDRRASLLLTVLIVITLILLWSKPMWKHENPETQVPDSLVMLLDDAKRETSRPKPYVKDRTPSLPRENNSASRTTPKPYDTIRIHNSPEIEEPDNPTRRKNPYANYMQNKYKPGKFVDLNTADTTELMRIPGIGPVRAKHIVEYRQSLGGFHSIAQVHEAYDLPEHLGDWVHISKPMIEPLHVNKAALAKLNSHPYLTFYQARAIVELRRREGRIRSARQLLFLEEFTEEDIARLAPYLSFE